MTHSHQARPLCPHLAAAALWMTAHASRTRNGKAARVRSARVLGAAMDDFLAL